MNKIVSLTLLLSTFILANMNVVVSILPEQTFVKAIGGDKVDVALMVLPGNSPHTYEPKPSQMKEIANASLYFAIGVEFEKVWLPKFRTLNSSMKVVDLSSGIEKREIAAHHHYEHNEHHSDVHQTDERKDPHIWTDPKNVRKIAQNIFEALSKNDPKNSDYYKKNLESFLSKVDATDKEIRALLADTPKGTKFMVFHPSWGYFAHAYGLEQLAVEISGKSPKPKEMIVLIKEARAEKVKAIFTQPEFSDAMAKVMAKELHIEVIKVSPLAADWSANLLKIAHAIAGK